MRLLVVVAGMTLGLSGCITGGIIHRAPAGNETAEQSDPSAAVDQAPWQLNGTAGARDDAGKAGKDGAGGKGAPKGGSGQGGNDGAGGSGGSGDDPGEPGGNGTHGGDGSGLEDITDQAPTEGAADAGDVVSNVGDAVEEGAGTSTPKDPVGDPDVDDTEVSVPISGSAGVPGAPKAFPHTDPTMLA